MLGTVKRRNTLDAVLAVRQHEWRLAHAGGRASGLADERLPVAVPRSRAGARGRERRGGAGRTARAPAAAAYVNAVLRRIATDGRRAPDRSHRRLGRRVRWSLRYSHPEWLVRLWLDELGGEAAAALMEADNRAPERALRVSRLRATPAQARASLAGDGIEAGDADGLPDALALSRADRRVETQRARSARVWSRPQSRGSQLVGTWPPARCRLGAAASWSCAPPPAPSWRRSPRCCRAGSSPRSTTIAARVEVMERNLRALGVGDVTVLAADAPELPAELDGAFDAVLLDAPCTGLGTLASRADLRWRRRAGGRAAPGRRCRRRLLAARRPARRALGGALAYAVCTITRAETLGVVDALLAAGGWAVDDLGAELAGLRAPAQRRLPAVAAFATAAPAASSSRACAGGSSGWASQPRRARRHERRHDGSTCTTY